MLDGVVVPPQTRLPLFPPSSWIRLLRAAHFPPGGLKRNHEENELGYVLLRSEQRVTEKKLKAAGKAPKSASPAK